jgi:peroxiredoxin
LEGALERQRITLIAVSSGAPRDLQRVQTQLANGRPLQFVFLADADLKVFEQYQLIDKRDSGLLHGIFCIDERGELIWQSGATASPYKDVVDAVNALATQSRPVVTTLR